MCGLTVFVGDILVVAFCWCEGLELIICVKTHRGDNACNATMRSLQCVKEGACCFSKYIIGIYAGDELSNVTSHNTEVQDMSQDSDGLLNDSTLVCMGFVHRINTVQHPSHKQHQLRVVILNNSNCAASSVL